MTYYILYDRHGEISSTVSGDEQLLVSTENLDLSILMTAQYVPINSGYVFNNQYTPYTEEQLSLKQNKPPYPAKWSNTTMSWEDLRSSQQKLDQQWKSIKSQRDQLLQDSDWRVIKATDTGIPLSQNWKDYRQALRDITTQTDPFNITWPTPPA